MAKDLEVRTYHPKSDIFTWGSIIFYGVQSIKIIKDKEDFTKDEGTDGTVDRINMNSSSCTVEVELKQTSPTNDALSLAAIADRETNAGKAPAVLKDLNGTTSFFAAQAWIKKVPDDERTNALTNRLWTFDTGPATKFTGGNIL